MAERRYWDSGCFIAWFKEETGRVDTCGAILNAAEGGDIELVTSAFTITEVVWPKGREKLDARLRKMVTDFFRQPWIIMVQVDRLLAEEAQRLVWEKSVHPKDAVHVASALRAGVYSLETYDEGLIKLTGRRSTDA